MALTSPPIGNWTRTQLVKFIKDILASQTTQTFTSIKADNITVTGTLQLLGKLAVPTADFQKIGATGQPGFDNGWVSWGAPYHDVGYWKDPLGFVHLRGTLKLGTVGSGAFTLPPGSRPDASAGPFIVLSNNAVGRVEISSDGVVTPISPSSNAFVTLDGIYFRAA